MGGDGRALVEWRDGVWHTGSTGVADSQAAGIFTTAGCLRGTPFMWQRHVDRMRSSLAQLAPHRPVDLPPQSAVEELLRDVGLLDESRLRITVYDTPQDDSRWAVSGDARPLAPGCCGPDLSPLRLNVGRWAVLPPLIGHKTTVRRSWDAAREAARREGADDALLVSTTGDVLETSTANIWVRTGESVATPPAPGRCLPGIMRSWLLDILPRTKLHFEIRDVDLRELEDADEVWVTNAVVGLRRVASIGRWSWKRWPGFMLLRELGVPAPGWSGSPA